MLCSAVNLELGEKPAAQAVLRQHPAYCRLDQPFGLVLAHLAGAGGANSTWVPGMTVIEFVLRLGAGELYFGGVDDDDEIAGILIRREVGAMFAAEHTGGTR